MRNIAIGILLVILVSILVEPLVELANVFREKLVVSTALSNACRVAKDRSLEYEKMIDLSAEIDEEKFKEYFETAFEDAMNVTASSSSGNRMTFTSNNGKYNDFVVTLDFDQELKSDVANQYVTHVNVRVESPYKFKTKYLRLAEAANEDVDFQIIADRSFVMTVKN